MPSEQEIIDMEYTYGAFQGGQVDGLTKALNIAIDYLHKEVRKYDHNAVNSDVSRIIDLIDQELARHDGTL